VKNDDDNLKKRIRQELKLAQWVLVGRHREQ